MVFPSSGKRKFYKASRKPQAFKLGDECCPERSGAIRRSRRIQKKPWPSGQGVSFRIVESTIPKVTTVSMEKRDCEKYLLRITAWNLV